MFQYRKLYADIVTEANLVCIAYVAELRLLGLRILSAGYECYAPDGSRNVVHALGSASVEMTPSQIGIRFQTQYGLFSYALTRDVAPADEHHLVPGLSWQILSPVAHATVRGVAGNDELFGRGYSDCVRLSRPPRTLGLASLSWGRGDSAARRFVFTEARFRNGLTFQNAQLDGNTSSRLSLGAITSGGVELQTDAISFRLENERVLHDGAALDELRFPSRTERSMVKLLTGSVWETRALAKVTSERRETGTALYERVTFGT